ncbi:hypothetical protein X975_27109, partial [Stegodyphus mimosarum]
MEIYIFMLFLSAFLISEARTKSDIDHKKKLGLAISHHNHIMSNFMCGTPQPRVVKVERLGYRLWPPATVLHRCGDSTGCCEKMSEQCVVKKEETVELYFRMLPITGHRKRGKIEMFTFTNHTECFCVDKQHVSRCLGSECEV